MKRNILSRVLWGAPVGLLIATTISLCVSWGIGDGDFHPVVPALTEQMGSEIKAVTLQTLLSMLYGGVFGGASVVWEMERWSALRQTITHILLVAPITYLIAYWTKWMHPSVAGVLIYFGIFFAIYTLIWCLIKFITGRNLAQINRKMGKTN